MKTIFMSYKYEDKGKLEGIKGMINNPNNSLNAMVRMEEEDVSKDGKRAIQDHIKEKMKGSNIICLLIGKDTHSSLWVDYELELAKQWLLPVLVIKIKDEFGDPPRLKQINKKKYAIYNRKDIQRNLSKM